MANKKNEIPVATFGELVDQELDKRGSTRRWLMAQLKEIGLELTDTQLSNRCTGFIEFKDEEKIKINKILGTEF